jgi:transcriptional regulator with XRE-family HTH domain
MGTIGSRLKEYREHLKLSQEEFADKCGVSQGNITQWETDTVKPARKLSLVIKACPDLNIDWLMNGTGNMVLPGNYSSVSKEDEKLRTENGRLKQKIKDQEETIKKLQEDVSSLIELLKKK